MRSDSRQLEGMVEGLEAWQSSTATHVPGGAQVAAQAQTQVGAACLVGEGGTARVLFSVAALLHHPARVRPRAHASRHPCNTKHKC